jgi:PKD repeat protein
MDRKGAIRYRIWDGVALGPELTVSGFNDDVFVLRAAEDPASDTIVLAAIDKFFDITVAVWDGDAWIDSREVDTAGAANTVQSLDVAWEASGEDALVVWAPWNQNYVRSLAWREGTMLADSTVEQGPDFQDLSLLVRLLPISGTEKIVLLGENWNLQELRYSLWDGNRLKGDPAILLESDIPVNFDIAFDLAEANVPRSGGMGSGIVTNQPPTVDAGMDETIYLPINQVDLDGTVTDDGLPNPPATVTTTWSVISGPGSVNFDDSSLVDTVARFSDAGEYVLRLTADDSELSDFDEVTIIVDSCTLLLVVADASSLTSGETARKTMLEGWGWTVSVISDHATQGEFDAETATVDVAYIPATIDGTILGAKLRETTIGVVIEKKMNDFGIASSWLSKSRDEINIIDNSHYITSPFDVGLLTYLSSLQPVSLMDSGRAPGLNTLAETFNTGSIWKPSFGVIDTGGELSGG